MDLGDYLGIPLTAALAIVIGVSALYLIFAALLAVASQRIFCSPSSLNLAFVSVLGAVIGRAMLGPITTLASGLVALGTLVVLQLVTGPLRQYLSGWLGHQQAVPVVVAGVVDTEAMERFQLSDENLWGVLRSNGVGHLDQVALAVVESSGRFSVLRSDQPLDARALTGVSGGDGLRRRLDLGPTDGA